MGELCNFDGSFYIYCCLMPSIEMIEGIFFCEHSIIGSMRGFHPLGPGSLPGARSKWGYNLVAE